MLNKDIWKIAMEQSAIDLNCSSDDFSNNGNTVLISKPNEGRTKKMIDL